MKTALGTFAALLFAGTLCAHSANAQPAPQGSYLNSCTHVGMDRDKLIADCRRVDGRWQRTVLDIDRCVGDIGDIGNINGHLTCNRGPHEGYGSNLRRRLARRRSFERRGRLARPTAGALLAHYGSGRTGAVLVGPLTALLPLIRRH